MRWGAEVGATRGAHLQLCEYAGALRWWWVCGEESVAEGRVHEKLLQEGVHVASRSLVDDADVGRAELRSRVLLQKGVVGQEEVVNC